MPAAGDEAISSFGYRWVRIGMVVLLFAAMAWLVDLGAALSLLQQTQWQWMILALAVVQVQIVLSAWRWQMTAVRLGHNLSLMVAIREYYLASAVNMSMPGGITGDALRAVRARRGSTLGVATQGVVLERLAGQLALFFITLAGWLCWPLLMGNDTPDIASRLIATVLAVLVCVGLMKWCISRFTNSRLALWVNSFGLAIHRAWMSDNQWLPQTVLSVAIVLSYLLVFALCAQALDRALPVNAVVTLVPLVLMSMIVPFTIGGWGIREAVAAVLWPLAGLSAESGIASSVLYGVIILVGSIPGSLLALHRR